MRCFDQFWADENGVLLSTEAILLGIVAVAGVTAGGAAMSSSLNEQIDGCADSIRCLDQSFEVPAQSANGSFVAGSRFQQQPVEQSQADLRDQVSQMTEGERNADADHHNADELARILYEQSGLSAAAIEDIRKEKQPQRRTQGPQPIVNPAPGVETAR